MTEYDLFFALLDRCPRISGLWDRNQKELDLERFKKELGGLSSGEAYMARFFAGVWFNKNEHDFDLIGSVHTLDTENRQIIIDWLNDPVFP